MRLFVESVLEPLALDEVWSVGQQMRGEPGFPHGAVRWVKREAMHLTLRFLGEVNEDRLPEIIGALAELQGAGRFDLRLVTVGSFGGRRPRVIWVGIEQDDGYQQLQRMRLRLDEALATMGFETEGGAYRPHLTLGRVRRQATRDDQAAIRSAVETAPPLRIRASVSRAALVESTLLKDGPRYRRLALTEL